MSFDFSLTGCYGPGRSKNVYTSSDLTVTESSGEVDSRDIKITGKIRGVSENVTGMHRFPPCSGTQGYSVVYKNGNTKTFQLKKPQEDECKKVSHFLNENGIKRLMLTDLLCKGEKRAKDIIESDGYRTEKYPGY